MSRLTSEFVGDASECSDSVAFNVIRIFEVIVVVAFVALNAECRELVVSVLKTNWVISPFHTLCTRFTHFAPISHTSHSFRALRTHFAHFAFVSRTLHPFRTICFDLEPVSPFVCTPSFSCLGNLPTFSHPSRALLSFPFYLVHS